MLGRGFGGLFDLLFLLLPRLARRGASGALLGLELIAKLGHLKDQLIQPHLLAFVFGVGGRFGKSNGEFGRDRREAILEFAAGRTGGAPAGRFELFKKQLGELGGVEPRITLFVGFDTIAVDIRRRGLNNLAEYSTPELVGRNIVVNEFGDSIGSLQMRIHEPVLFLAAFLLARRRLCEDSRAAIEAIGVSDDLIRHIILTADFGLLDRLDIVISQDGYSQR